jgi:hypothetical protein
MREELKLKQTTAQMAAFYSECKSFCSVPDFLEELKAEDRAKDKERLKNFHASLDNFKVRKETLETIMVQEPGTNEVDTKQSIVNFLSTVVYEAEQLGINYEKLFSSTHIAEGPRPIRPPGPGPVGPPVIDPVGGVLLKDLVSDQVVPQEKPEQHLKFSVQQY